MGDGDNTWEHVGKTHSRSWLCYFVNKQSWPYAILSIGTFGLINLKGTRDFSNKLNISELMQLTWWSLLRVFDA